MKQELMSIAAGGKIREELGERSGHWGVIPLIGGRVSSGSPDDYRYHSPC